MRINWANIQNHNLGNVWGSCMPPASSTCWQRLSYASADGTLASECFSPRLPTLTSLPPSQPFLGVISEGSACAFKCFVVRRPPLQAWHTFPGDHGHAFCLRAPWALTNLSDLCDSVAVTHPWKATLSLYALVSLLTPLLPPGKLDSILCPVGGNFEHRGLVGPVFRSRD